ncbi:MAG: rRNA pseudouridine synthase [Spirochaetales bacterium]|nr:rRNA pseudouridine synthase [Spirochaetales bacterium]
MKSNRNDLNSDNTLIRLQLFLARAGIASRRACEQLIQEGRVSVNGEIITRPGCKVSDSDTIQLDGVAVTQEIKHISIVLHKPVQVLCSNKDDQGRPLASDLFRKEIAERLFHAGRLDFMSSGLIIYTNDGELAKIITHPSYQVEKEYEVKAFHDIPDEMLEGYKNGIELDGDFLQLKSFQKIDRRTVFLVISQGKNREIRRVCDHFDVTIQSLCRVRIGPVRLNKLLVGTYRTLSLQEIEWFKSRVPQKKEFK